ncbi:MAG: 4-(cytidine 5'-diphospho)-2-C-methyl-D-erythritol kinase, partial [Chitinophagaceae bacterium]
MVTFPSAKINIGLQVLGKRVDGFHDLNTIFYPLPFYDALELIIDHSTNDISFRQSGIGLDVTPEQNLVSKAWRLLKADFPAIKGIHTHLHKSIPSGAGLGGGSSDAASMLKLLNDVFHLNINIEQLCVYALSLGSDCPFFIHGAPSLARGRGEVLSGISLDLSSYDILLVNPNIHINTGYAFSQLKKYSEEIDLEKAVALPVSEWKKTIVNDFEQPVTEAHPEIKELISLLYNRGALYASLTGTGSTVYGIFEKGK